MIMEAKPTDMEMASWSPSDRFSYPYRAAPSNSLASPPSLPPHISIKPVGKNSPKSTDYEKRMPPKRNGEPMGQNRGQRSKGDRYIDTFLQYKTNGEHFRSNVNFLDIISWFHCDKTNSLT